MLPTFFQLGFRHLTQAGALDHQLFLATIALAYAPSRWRRWVGLATAFALAHTASVALVAAGAAAPAAHWVEPAIATSVVALALLDAYFLWRDPLGVREPTAKRLGTLAVVIGFGLVHGLGFGGGFVAVAGRGLSAGELAGAVAAFTVGVEAAQLLLLAGMWVAAFAIFDLAQWRPLVLRRGLLLGVAAAGLWLLADVLAT